MTDKYTIDNLHGWRMDHNVLTGPWPEFETEIEILLTEDNIRAVVDKLNEIIDRVNDDD